MGLFQGLGKEGRVKRTLPAACCLVVASCGEPACPAPPDMTPIGEGLSVIGFCLIGVAVVVVLGRLLS